MVQQCPWVTTRQDWLRDIPIGEGMTQRGDVRRQSPLRAMRPRRFAAGSTDPSGASSQSLLLSWHPAMPTATYPYLARGVSTFFWGVAFPRGRHQKSFLSFWFFVFCLFGFYRRPAWTRRLCLLRSSSWISSAITETTLTSGAWKSSASQAPS